MMVVLNVLFLAVLCAILYAAFLGLWIAALFLFRVKHKFWYGSLSLPVFLVALFAYHQWRTRPVAVFENSFGFAPTADVVIVRSSQHVLGDCGVVYLHFRANTATVQRIVARGLTATGSGGSTPGGFNQAPPSWWLPSPTSSVEYVGNFRGRDFANEEEYLIHNPATGDVWFRFIGID